MKDKRITNIARITLILFNVGLFTLVWVSYYNDYAWRTHKTRGIVVSILAFYILYHWLAKLYRGYAIASSPVEETVLSQFISFGIADLILYVSSVLLHRDYVNVWPGAFIVVCQLVGTTMIVWISKRYILVHVQPSSTLLVCGTGAQAQLAQFKRQVEGKLAHLFSLDHVVTEGALEEIESKIDGIDTVMLMSVSPQSRDALIHLCLAHRKTFYFAPDFIDIICRGCEVANYLDTPLLKYDYTYSRQRNLIIKRVCDIVLSAFFLVVLSPVFLVAAIAIKLEDRGPVFYFQDRVTLDGRVFRIVKFRSMIVDAEVHGAKPATQDDPRITKVGRFLRKYRIDEMPQFVNVLLGQMSLVGPRPERTLHETLYEQQLPDFKYRLRVKSGLTGYAQVYGKYNTPPEDKLKMDMLYIENQSLLLDFQLILLTIKIMFKSEATEGFDETQSTNINKHDQKKAG